MLDDDIRQMLKEQAGQLLGRVEAPTLPVSASASREDLLITITVTPVQPATAPPSRPKKQGTAAAILEVLRAERGKLTGKEIYAALRGRGQKCTQDTVWKALWRLRQEGRVRNARDREGYELSE